MENHQPAKFGGHMHWGSGDITILVCDVISQEHEIKGSCNVIGKGPSW